MAHKYRPRASARKASPAHSASLDARLPPHRAVLAPPAYTGIEDLRDLPEIGATLLLAPGRALSDTELHILADTAESVLAEGRVVLILGDEEGQTTDARKRLTHLLNRRATARACGFWGRA